MNTPDRNRRDKTSPPAPSPEPEQNPGYAETEPRDKDDARRPHPKRHEPEEGGLHRKSDGDPDPTRR